MNVEHRVDRGGFVRLFRSLLDNPTFRSHGEAMFFAYLVVHANWRDGRRRYDERVYELRRGDLVLGERKLADEFDWSHKKVRGIMIRLEEAKMITRKRAQHGIRRAPVISICNYDKYQLSPDGGAQAGAQGGHT